MKQNKLDIFEIPNQISDYGYGTAGNEDNIEEIGRFELEGHLGSSDFGGATTGYGTADFSTDEIGAEGGVEFNPGPNWGQSPDLPMGQEILFNGGERISSKFMTSIDLQRSQFSFYILVDGENMSQYQNQMGSTSATNCYDRNYASDPQIGHFSPNFHNLPSFSGISSARHLVVIIENHNNPAFYRSTCKCSSRISRWYSIGTATNDGMASK